MKGENDELRERKRAAVNIALSVSEDDEIHSLLNRKDGLYAVTLQKVLRIKSPKIIDPNSEHVDVPWEQAIYLPHGSSDHLVARTILQTDILASLFFGKSSERYQQMMDVSWEVMNSLVSLRYIRDRLSRQITDLMNTIEEDWAEYTQGQSPKPLPIVPYLDIEFRSFANEVRRTLNKISEVFLVLTGKDFSGGNFLKALAFAERKRGSHSQLAVTLKDDQRWIKTWIDVRIAIEHPREDKFVETSNFSLEANRGIRLPTWRFVYPGYDMSRPQNLLEVLEICENNLLKFFEDLQILLSDGNLPMGVGVEFTVIPESEREQRAPIRFKMQLHI